MTSHPPDKCCFVAFKHEGEAQGKVEKFGSHDCYVSRPSNGDSKSGIVIFPDFMGYELINVKLIADRLAAAGFLTVIPDMWEGDNVPLEFGNSGLFDLGKWVSKHGPDRAMPTAEATISTMREQHGVQKIGGVGYCLGAKYVCRCMAKNKGLDAGFSAHPSLVTPEEIEGLAGPLSIAAAETDDLFPAAKRHETETILEKMDIPYQMCLYSNVEHGFALKADLSKPDNRFVTETAFLQAMNWFDHYLK